MTSPMPAWAQRRRDEREAEQARRWQARMTPLLDGLLQVDAIWSNANLQAYCMACRASAPSPAFEIGLPPETRCAHCGETVGSVAARKVG